MKKFLLYLAPLALIYVLASMLPAGAGVTPSSVTSLRSPTPVLNGPILGGRLLNLGEVSATNPNFANAGAGLQRPIGSIVYTPAGNGAFIKTGTLATNWEFLTAGSIGGAGTRPGALTARAAQLAALNPSLITCFHEDFVYFPSNPAGTIYTSLLSGSGTLASATTTTGGQVVSASGATANSISLLSTTTTVVGPVATQPFYFAARFAVTTAIDAQTFGVSGIQLPGFGAGVNMGVCGVSSTVNYVAQYDGSDCSGTFLSTGKAIDTSYHVFEIYGKADGKYHFIVDGTEISGSPVTPVSPPANPLRLISDVRNGATAANRSATIDWFHACWNEV